MSRVSVETKAPEVFLCHSAKDKPFVRRLANDLTGLGVQVWLDEWKLTVGDVLHEAIGTAIQSSAFVAVVISPASSRSQWVRRELSVALANEVTRRKKLVLPLILKGSRLPPFLSDRLYLDFRVSYYPAVSSLAGAINRLNQRQIARALSSRKPRNLSDVKSILHGAGWKEFVFIPRTEFEKIVAIMHQAGISIQGDSFAIAPRAEDLVNFQFHQVMA